MHQIRRNASRVATAGLVMLLSGCGSSGGGGGGGSVTPPTGSTTASVTFVIPPASSQQISPNYISPNTSAFQIVIDNVNGSPTVPAGIPATTTVNLTTGSGGTCGALTPTGQTCTVPFQTPAGNIVFTFTILDKAGEPLATVKKELTIVKGQSNANLQVILDGIVAKVTVLVPTFLSGVPLGATPLLITAFDASGATIDASAPFAVPILLTDTDKTNSTHLEVRNGIGPTAQVNSASDVVYFIYNGNPSVPPFFINATVGSTAVGSAGPLVPTTQDISFSNTYIDTQSKQDLNYEQPTLFFDAVGQKLSTTASEVGYNGTFTAALDPATCAGPVATISASPATTFTVTAENPGVCKVVVSDTISHQSVFWISVTTAVIGINSRTHRIVK